MVDNPASLDEALIARFAAIVGPAHAFTAPAETEPYAREFRGLFPGRAGLVLRPADTGEVSRIMALATATHTPVVPQGGNTGLVGGGVPDDTGGQVVVSMSRLDRIRETDLLSGTVIAEAGVILHALRAHADAHDRLFPLSLGSQGSCQIGGNLSTNAGGTGALVHGVARDLCLGVEVVLPTGEVLDDLRKLKKDNTGYDLKDLFIGAEGTLGIITAAVLKLVPKPLGREVAWVGLDSPSRALSLFDAASRRAGSNLTAFELMQDRSVDFVVRHIPGMRAPLSGPHGWQVLMEFSSGRSRQDARDLAEQVLSEALEAQLIDDAVLAGSLAQCDAMWKLRESMSEGQRPEGASIKHDVSVPVAAIPAFIERAGRAVAEVEPGGRVVCFGHMGDGNLHYNISQPPGGDRDAFLSRYRAMNDAVHSVVRAFGGSISAEHGIGRMKRDELAATGPAVAIGLMRRIKATLDPAGIMNPGKVI